MAKKEHYIIDGYNVINAWPELIALRDNLELARDKFIDMMAEYGAYQQYDITIVFDALFTVHDQSCEKINNSLEVVFTDEGETADSFIEKQAYILVRQRKEVYVVTSDGAQQSVILGAGAYRISSREFRRAVHKAKQKMEDDYIKRPSLISRFEVGGRVNSEIAKKLDELRKMK